MNKFHYPRFIMHMFCVFSSQCRFKLQKKRGWEKRLYIYLYLYMYWHLNGICTHACICVCYVNRHTLLNVAGYGSKNHGESLETWFNSCFSSFCFWYCHILPSETLTFSSSQLLYFLLFKQLGWYYNDFPKEPGANTCI